MKKVEEKTTVFATIYGPKLNSSSCRVTKVENGWSIKSGDKTWFASDIDNLKALMLTWINDLAEKVS